MGDRPTMAIGVINSCITFLNLSPSDVEPQQPFFLLIAMLFDVPLPPDSSRSDKRKLYFPSLNPGIFEEFPEFLKIVDTSPALSWEGFP